MIDDVVYILKSCGGGIDGRDTSDKPKDYYATTDRQEAEKAYEESKAKGYPITVRVEGVQLKKIYNELNLKLTPVEKLALRLYGCGQKSK